jgi:arylsulfatase A-like enzyme
MNTIPFNRRSFLKLMGTTVSGIFPSYFVTLSCKNILPQKPNIIFIMADDLGLGEVGCYGQKEIQTPNIDRLAGEGMRFTQAYAGSPVCAPSRCVLMTGLHTGHSRVRGNHGKRDNIPLAEEGQPNRVPLEREDLTVAELLKSAGYITGISGKWGLGEPGSTGIPNGQGFDFWLGFLNQDHAVDYYTPYLWKNQEKLYITGNTDNQKKQYVHDLFTEFALNFLKTNHTSPFFLYLPYTIPHKNYEVPDLGIYEGENWPEEKKIYAAMVTRLDRDIGKILSLLDELGISDKTVIFFTSDNGASGSVKHWQLDSWKNLRGTKGELYEGGIRVPFIVRWNNHIKRNSVNQEPVYFADFLPTVLELSSIQLPENIDGVSFLPILLGQPQDLSERFLYWEFHKPEHFSQAVRWKNWKVVKLGLNEKLELYDLERDESETINISQGNPKIMAKFENYLKTARIPSQNWPVPGID